MIISISLQENNKLSIAYLQQHQLCFQDSVGSACKIAIYKKSKPTFCHVFLFPVSLARYVFYPLLLVVHFTTFSYFIYRTTTLHPFLARTHRYLHNSMSCNFISRLPKLV
ncbi:hypothetical protein O6P43_032350 [Quillaja saponaria]|uniref:Uncharacterized protein n=1 Tax=Quillaja saponaria TaxID=32244 RepID=A0AAD7P5E3_QUISA|nr:hypothetical protein O6P43_032350 [Quillaja saponaria]